MGPPDLGIDVGASGARDSCGRKNIFKLKGVLSDNAVSDRGSVGSQEDDRIALAVAQRAGEGADAARIADAIIALWQQIESVLAPIVGQRGVAALYKRSLYVAAVVHPWLELQEDPEATPDLAALKSAISRQRSVDATAGGVAMLEAFHTLLISLIGSSLTERLLDAVWAHRPSSGSSAQDPSS